MELMGCPGLAVPPDVMHHVVNVESSFNPYAIGVVGGRLVRQPGNLPEAVATARMLESRGYNFSLGLAQVNRYNLARYGLESYEAAFQACPNLRAGARILADCHARSGQDWGRSFSCYYSGNFTTGFRAGYVQKIFASMRRDPAFAPAFPGAIPVVGSPTHRAPRAEADVDRRTAVAGRREPVDAPVPPTRRETATRGVAASVGGPASAPVVADRPDTDESPDGIAVLQPAGRAPRIVQARDATPPLAPTPARDAAFVF